MWHSGNMVRGWESKSVESHIELAEKRAALAKLPKFTSDQAERIRQRQSLLLSRTRVETSRNPRFRKTLEASPKSLTTKSRVLHDGLPTMVRSFLCIAIAGFSLMGEQQFHIDHVIVAGKNLEAMEKALTQAGVPNQFGGQHSNHVTEMAMASFPDGSYLELIAIQPMAEPAAVAAHEWRKFMEGDAGPCAWAVRPQDLFAEAERLTVSKIAVGVLRKNGRKRPDGVQLDWETAQVGPTNGGFFPFLIHDLTPRDNRAFPSGSPSAHGFTGWTGIARVVIAVRDLDAAIALYRQAYWIDPPERQVDAEFGAKLAWFRGTPVVLAAPLSPKSWLNDRLEKFGEAPCAFILGPWKGSYTMEGAKSKWFGHSVFWADAGKLGWHLGFQPK